MTSRQTWFWLVLALGLALGIVVHQRQRQQALPGAARILPGLKPAAVTSVQLQLKGQAPIRAERTNNTWQLTEPLHYPAQGLSIEHLLASLEHLTPTTFISENELTNRAHLDEEYGFAEPQATLLLSQPGHDTRLRVGSRSAPGDEVFLQIAGREGIYVAPAELLKEIPHSANAWRDTSFVELKGLSFNQVAVTNLTKETTRSFVVQRDSTNRLWRMVWPLLQGARADNARIEDSLQKLQSLRIEQFVSDAPKVEAETFGLAAPELTLALRQGTNPAVVLEFGKSPTNEELQVYARRAGQNTIVTVSKDLLSSWRASANEFRDPHLVTLTESVTALEVQALDTFSLQRQTNGSWRILPQNLPADAPLASDLLTALTRMPITQFVKDVVNSPDLPDYGLDKPARRIVLQTAATNSAAASKAVLVDLSFGLSTNQLDKVFVRRTDESSVYAISTNDFQQLPAFSWQMRERKLWNISLEEVARATIHQNGRVRQLVRNGPNQWSLAPGSQGVINDLAVEQTVQGLTKASAAAWVAFCPTNLASFGFDDNSYRITLELKSGEKLTIAFGYVAPSGAPFATVTLDGQVWVMEFPWILFRDLVNYLSTK